MDDKGLMSFKNEVEIMLYLTNKLRSDLFDGDEDVDEQQTHPSIVKIFHYFEDARRFLLVTELCEKGELFGYIQENDGKIELDQAALILKQVISALLFMHNKKIVHRDLKPENILIDSISKDYIQIKLIDFGTAFKLT